LRQYNWVDVSLTVYFNVCVSVKNILLVYDIWYSKHEIWNHSLFMIYPHGYDFWGLHIGGRHNAVCVRALWLSVFLSNILSLSSQTICRLRQWHPSIRLHGAINQRIVYFEHITCGTMSYKTVNIHNHVTTEHLWPTLC
jgi:hypothetical protein